MLDGSGLDKLLTSLGAESTDKLPDVVYGDNFLRIRFVDAVLEIKAEDFLKGITLEPLPDVPLMPLPRLSTEDNSLFAAFKGVVTPLVSGTETWKQQAEKTGAKQGIEFHKIQPKLDWTATSLFLPNVAHTTQTEAESALPLPLLADTSLPILFYKMIPLYFDDLGDSGIVDLHCRVRVMPTFWFLLVRLVVRVDEVLIRCIDHRFFHEFGKKYISSETSLFEAAWSKLRSPLTHDALNASHGADLLTNEHRRFHMCRRFNL